MIVLLIGLFVVAWVAAGLLGTQAYFRGEQSKPIHERNWRSSSFENLAETLTGQSIDYQTRSHAFGRLDAYSSKQIAGQ